MLRQQDQRKVVLWHSDSNQLTVRTDFRTPSPSASSSSSLSEAGVGLELIAADRPIQAGLASTNRSNGTRSDGRCPLCHRRVHNPAGSSRARSSQAPTYSTQSYFQLLSTANTPRTSAQSFQPAPATLPEEELDARTLNAGYYDAYFDELQLLGRGGQGAVYLARHTLNGESLGIYAVKKGKPDQTPAVMRSLTGAASLTPRLRNPSQWRWATRPRRSSESCARCACSRPCSTPT